jgi:Flp pilus assembly protein TadG
VTVEFALMFFLLVLFMFTIFEYGRLLMMRHLVNNAAREAARQAAIDCNFTQVSTSGPPVFAARSPSLQTSDIQTTLFNFLASQPLNNSSGQPLQPSDVTVTLVNPGQGQKFFTDAVFGQGVVVTVDARYQSMLPGLTFLPLAQITVVCTMGSEANN